MQTQNWTIDLPDVPAPLPAPESFVVRKLAQLLSYLFHPLFIPLYATWFLAYVHPSYFAGFGSRGKQKLMVLMGLNTVFFPLITVLLLKGLGFIQSIFLHTSKDRIIPYISTMTFYFWAQYVLREQGETPTVLVAFMFGAFISTAAALIANIYFKVSMHGIGMGGLTGLLFVILYLQELPMAWPLALVILLTGFVCTARLLVSDHSNKEVYVGLLIGIFAQWVGAIIYA